MLYMGRPSKRPRTAFGERLFAARTASGLSQVEVAEKLGITQTAYALWERRPVALRPDQIEMIAKILGVAVEELFTSNGRNKKPAHPIGRARRAFEQVSKLPCSQQQYILQVVEALVKAKKGSAE